MPLVTGCRDRAAQREAPFEECERAPLGLFIRVILTNERVDLLSEQPADGRVAFGGEHLRLAKRLAIESNGNVLFVGGEDNVGMTLTSAEIYDSKMGTFKQTGGLAQARYGHTATLMSNGKVLVVGGYFDDFPLSRAEVYDPVAGRFTDTGPLVKGRTGHTATLLQNGKVLIAGGIGDSGKLSSLELYDPSTGVFSLIGRFVDANQSHIPVLLKNGNVLFIGNSTVELFVLAMIQ